MNTITIELTPEMAEKMLPFWALQRAQKAAELEELDEKIKKVKSALGKPVNENNGVPEKTPDGRNKRGESAKLISQYLESKNGQGATLNEITEATGTVYGTARRVLHYFKKEKMVRTRAGLWKWKTIKA